MAYEIPDEIVLSGSGPVRTLMLNRPEQLNAVNHSLHRALGGVWTQLREDREVRVVILTGAGRAFCAGGDYELIEGLADDPEDRWATVQDARRIVREMVDFPLPIVAAVNGPAAGLGCSLALLSDIIFMSEDTYLVDPHVSLGVVAADGGVLAWPLLTSLARAKEYLFTGDRISAIEAERIGLVNRVVPPVALMAEVATFAERLADQPPQALRDTKRAINLHLKRAVCDVIDFAFAAESESFAHPRFAEYMASYSNRRRDGATP